MLGCGLGEAMTAARELSLAVQRLRASRTLAAKARQLVPRGRADRELLRALMALSRMDARLVKLRQRLEGE